MKHDEILESQAVSHVASHAEAWIETLSDVLETGAVPVASHAEAWIETSIREAAASASQVASHAEAWIETSFRPPRTFPQTRVASHAEAWIETIHVCAARNFGRLLRGALQ